MPSYASLRLQVIKKPDSIRYRFRCLYGSFSLATLVVNTLVVIITWASVPDKYDNFVMVHITSCPRNSVTPLRFCWFCFDHNSEMEGLRELSDVLNLRLY
jgi:hypothetical protein